MNKLIIRSETILGSMDIWKSLFELLCDYGTCPYSQELSECQQSATTCAYMLRERQLKFADTEDPYEMAIKAYYIILGTVTNGVLLILCTFFTLNKIMDFLGLEDHKYNNFDYSQILKDKQHEGHRKAFRQINDMFQQQCRRTKKSLSKYSLFSINSGDLSALEWNTCALRVETLKSVMISCEKTVDGYWEVPLNEPATTFWEKLKEIGVAVEEFWENAEEMERIVYKLESARRTKRWESFKWYIEVVLPLHPWSSKKPKSNSETDKVSKTPLSESMESVYMFDPEEESSQEDTYENIEQSYEQKMLKENLAKSTAMAYVDRIKKRYSDHRTQYNTLLEIMTEYDDTDDNLSFIRRIVKLFRNEPFMILGINAFLRNGYSVKLWADNQVVVSKYRGNIQEVVEFMSLNE